jgi:hypothetical protein
MITYSRRQNKRGDSRHPGHAYRSEAR